MVQQQEFYDSIEEGVGRGIERRRRPCVTTHWIGKLPEFVSQTPEQLVAVLLVKIVHKHNMRRLAH